MSRRLFGSSFAAIAAVAAALAPMATPTRALAQDDGMIDVQICNRTGETVYVALAYKEHPGDGAQWIVEGWKNIAGGACQTYDVPTDGYFDYYAEDASGGVWEGDVKLCVERPGPFRRPNSPNYTCDDQNLVGFTAVDPNKTSTVNLNP
jgi:uncharacterized membrane protein